MKLMAVEPVREPTPESVPEGRPSPEIPPAAKPEARSGLDWPKLVADSVRENGPWPTYGKLLEARRVYPDDMLLRGYTEIIRNLVVKDLLAHPKGLQAVPKLSGDFLTDFGRFNLNAQEGYLISLIDGRLDLQKLLMLSPFDPFTTLFNIAKMQSQKAITVP